jgi:peptidoglycan/xylan/chitin deacetylase (PgdA/CDA1 family)
MTEPDDYAAHLDDDCPVILLFHGVVRRHAWRVRNYTRKHVDQDRFRAVLAALTKAGGVPVGMDDVLRAWESGGALPPRAFVVTFDDGFANNLEVAAPILADMRIPATFYVTTGFIEENRMSWVDRAETALEDAAPGRLTLPWGERRFSDDAGKIAVLAEMRTMIKSDRRLDGDEIATLVQRSVGLEPTFSGDGPLDRKLTWAETRALAQTEGFLVAGHSHTHAILSHLDSDALEREISLSLALLAEKAGVRNRHYAYPEGLTQHYSPAVIQMLQAYGVACCPSAESGRNHRGVGLFDLRRIAVT